MVCTELNSRANSATLIFRSADCADLPATKRVIGIWKYADYVAKYLQQPDYSLYTPVVCAASLASAFVLAR